MSPFWASLCEALRGRGRNGTLFFAVVLPLLGAVLITAQLSHEVCVDYLLPTLASVGLLMLLVFMRHWLRDRAWRRRTLARGGLSRDELDKARSKLVRSENRKLS